MTTRNSLQKVDYVKITYTKVAPLTIFATVAAFIVVWGLIEPLIWLGVVGVFCIALLFNFPKLGTAIATIAIMFAQSLETATKFGIFGYIDDTIILLCLFIFSGKRLAYGIKLRWIPAIPLFVAYIAIGTAGTILQGSPVSVALLGGFLSVKPIILLFAVAQINWTVKDIQWVANFGAWLLTLILISVVLNAIAPGPWNSIIGRQSLSVRGGWTSLTGLFDHPVGLGSTMALAFIAVYLYRQLVSKGTYSRLLLIGSGIATILAFRRKSIVSLILGAFTARMTVRLPKSLAIIAAAIIVPILLILTWDTLAGIVNLTKSQYLGDPESTARTLMTRDSLLIALAYFPLGAGLGRYGSHTAFSHYSEEYIARGYEQIYGMGRGSEGFYLADTFWPAILGETGFIGLMCYLTGLILVCKPAWRLARTSAFPHAQWIGAVTIGWLGALLVESLVAPVFVSPPMYGLLPVVAGISISIVNSKNALYIPSRKSNKRSDLTK